MESSFSYTDKELFVLISRENEHAFTIFFHKYRLQLFDYAFSLSKETIAAEEIVQEIFLKLWTSRLHLSNVDHPVAYLFRMAKNAGIDYLRKLSADRKHLNYLTIANRDHNNEETQNAVSLSETKKMLSAAIMELTPSQREVFYLSRYQGFSYEEIADKMGITRNTVKNHLTASLKTIKEYLGRQHGYVIMLVITSFLRN